MNIIVQKFGGSSVADEEKREKVIEKILRAKQEGNHVVVVLSAMGRAPHPYATDTLIGLVKFSEKHQICPRDLDLLTSCGETISCVVMAQSLRDRGHDAIALTGWQAGIITDNNFCDARIRKIQPDFILHNLEQGKTPIVTGFQGLSEDGEITTLGRGGSDTSATALGVALKAKAIEIYTDVDGVLSADPRILDSPRQIPELNYIEAGEMSGQGAKVLHKRCIGPAHQHSIPLWVKSTLTDNPGTRISNDTVEEGFETGRVVTTIVHVDSMAQIAVDLIDTQDRSLMRLELLRAFWNAGISIDFINVIREKLYFIVNEHEVMQVVAICRELDLPVSINHDCAKVSCVGIGMKGTPGVMASIQEALASAGVNMLQATDSHVTISCLVKGKDLKNAVAALADKFNLREY
ncbi:MAG: aspartate kinase [Vulcanimicrobiota bacterium]